jgi:hypothetical protein
MLVKKQVGSKYEDVGKKRLSENKRMLDKKEVE